MILNEKTFQKIYGNSKGEKTDNRCLFCCPGLREFSGGYCVCVCVCGHSIYKLS